jgi:hypothetical protein
MSNHSSSACSSGSSAFSRSEESVPMSPGLCSLSKNDVSGCIDPAKVLQSIVMNKVLEYADCFDNFERTKNGVSIYLGSGKFWVLDMRTIDTGGMK